MNNQRYNCEGCNNEIDSLRYTAPEFKKEKKGYCGSCGHEIKLSNLLAKETKNKSESPLEKKLKEKKKSTNPPIWLWLIPFAIGTLMADKLYHHAKEYERIEPMIPKIINRADKNKDGFFDYDECCDLIKRAGYHPTSVRIDWNDNALNNRRVTYVLDSGLPKIAPIENLYVNANIWSLETIEQVHTSYINEQTSNR